MKVHCPYHEDKEPSCEVYEDRCWCFVCGVPVPFEAVGKEVKPSVKPKEDLQAKMDYIASLPVGEFRGFSFNYDSNGFYLVWPDGSYYKHRLFDPKAKNRYLGPSGHKPPLFWARKMHYQTLFVVEGELDALSIASAISNCDVVSPGAASNFASDFFCRAYATYLRIVIAVDSDGPGIKAARELGSKLLYKVPKLSIIYKDLDNDFNDILVKCGKEALREEIEQRVLKAVSWEAP